MVKRTFLHKAETFGFETKSPWAFDAIRLIYSTPRTYDFLAQAWDKSFPGTIKALNRMVALGFVTYQPAIIVDTRHGTLASKLSNPVSRYKLNTKGKKLYNDALIDLRVLSDTFPRLTDLNVNKLLAFLDFFNPNNSSARTGMSIPAAVIKTKMPERSTRWWVKKLVDEGYMVELENKLPDIRELIPAHYRPTRMLSTQLLDVIEAFPEVLPTSMSFEYRLKRTRYLDDIPNVKIAQDGITDYEHDINCQVILSSLIKSEKINLNGVFILEPRYIVNVNNTVVPWQVNMDGEGNFFYQPDAEIREKGNNLVPIRCYLEYERFQNRRDGWAHIEKFLGLVHQNTLPVEPVILRFVVDSEPRAKAYVELIEAFADWALDNQRNIPLNTVELAVSTLQRITSAKDPLDPSNWFRVILESQKEGKVVPLIHSIKDSPYDEYFSGGEL